MNKSSALLYYTQPADCWEGALPLGNGRLGAMAYGGTEHEELALNEDTLWSGLPEHAYSGKVFENLPEARKMIRERRFTEADEFISREMLDHDSQSYLPAGKLKFEFKLDGTVSDYVRSLDLENALAATAAGFLASLGYAPAAGPVLLTTFFSLAGAAAGDVIQKQRNGRGHGKR